MFSLKKFQTFSKDYTKSKINKPKIHHINETIFVPKILNRKIGLFLDKKKKIISAWHINISVVNFIINNLLGIRLGSYIFNINYDLLVKFFLIIKKNQKIINLKKNEIFIIGPYSNIFFHQIFDFILTAQYFDNKNLNFYFPIYLKKIFIQKPYNKIFINKVKFYKYDKIFKIYNFNYASHLFHGKKNKYLEKSIIKLKNKIKFIEDKKLKYSIISRGKNSRRLINEHELYLSLKKHGFKIYDFDQLSQQKQISVFRNSKIVIGYHGSNLTNMIFMKKNSHLIEITNTFINNPCYKIVANTIKINYVESKCSKSFENLSGKCDIKKIIKVINKIKNSK